MKITDIEIEEIVKETIREAKRSNDAWHMSYSVLLEKYLYQAIYRIFETINMEDRKEE